MEKTKKELKICAIIVLILCGFSFVRMIVDACVHGIPMPEVREGMSVDLAKTIAKISFVLSFVVLLPQIYVGIKGLKVANGDTCNKAARVWAIILTIVFLFSAISAVSTMIKAFTLNSFVAALDVVADTLLFAAIYFSFRKITKA